MGFLKENQFWCIILGIVILMIIQHLISKESLIEGAAEMSIEVVNHTGDKETEEKDTDELAPVIDPNKLSEMDGELEGREAGAGGAAAVDAAGTHTRAHAHTTRAHRGVRVLYRRARAYLRIWRCGG